jgi:recombinase
MAKKLSGHPAWLGLSEDRTSFIFLPDRAKIVKEIFELSIAGIGGYTIAKQLNAKKVPAFGPSQNWDQSTIHNLLRNRATVGEHQPKKYRNRKESPVGDPVPGYYPEVIEESLFQAAQVARRKNLSSGRGRKGRHITNIFAGLLTCAYCANPIKFHSNGNAKSLICSTVINGAGCYRMAWSYRDFEDSFFDFVKNLMSESALVHSERKAVEELVSRIQALSATSLYEKRLELVLALKSMLSELKIASAGAAPHVGKPDARIRRDGPGRYFEVRFLHGSSRVGFPIDQK